MTIPSVYVLTGAALVWLRTRNAVGWILIGAGMCPVASTFLGAYGVQLYVVNGPSPAGQIALALASWLWLPGLFLLPTLLPLLYPGGHLPSPRWRLAVISTAVGLAALAPVAAFTVDSVNDWYGDARPLWVLPPAVEIALAVIGFGLLLVTSIACVGNAVVRTWRADAPERAQLAWLLTSTTAAAVLAFTAPAEWMLTVALVAVPVAVAVGVLRYGLLGIQVVLRPTLLYGLLTLLIAVVFAAVTTALSLVLPPGPLPTFAAAAVVAVGLVPAHARLRRFVGRLLDGPASDPLAAVSRVGLRRVAGRRGPHLPGTRLGRRGGRLAACRVTRRRRRRHRRTAPARRDDRRANRHGPAELRRAPAGITGGGCPAQRSDRHRAGTAGRARPAGRRRLPLQQR